MIKPHIFIRFFLMLFQRFFKAPTEIQLDKKGFKLKIEGLTKFFQVKEASSLTCTSGFLGFRIVLNDLEEKGTQGITESVTLLGISQLDTNSINTHINKIVTTIRIERERREEEARKRREAEERAWLIKEAEQLEVLATLLQIDQRLSLYLDKRSFQDLQRKIPSKTLKLIRRVLKRDLLTTPPPSLVKRAQQLSVLIEGDRLVDKYRESYNQAFIKKEARAHHALFNGVEAHPLTSKQVEACIVQEEATLVVAGAGTGKTSTVIGRCAYLINARRAAPHEILLLAYGKKASLEMSERLESRLGRDDVRASTFHSLGLDIIGEVEGRKPSLAVFASSEVQRGSHFKNFQDKLLSTDSTHREISLNFFSKYLNDSRSAFDFPDTKSYYDFIRSNHFITLKGELVNGYCEVLIANELYLGGLEYEYEAPYKIQTATSKRRAYQPDFYLPNHDLYIEFYGINRRGETAPCIDQERYKREMAWKRELHQKHNTACLELFYYQHQEESLTHDLWKSLKKHGVKRGNLDEERMLKELRETKILDAFSDLLASFTSLFKLSQRSLQELRNFAKSSPRLIAFLKVFERVFSLYEQNLSKRGEVDFEDMITTATEYVRSGRYRSPYTQIIVDEFQDISPARFTLLRALFEQVEESRIFCVGDDWQAIYRFSGGDLSLMTGFNQQFEYSELLSLDQTFRFNSALLAVTSSFVQNNPNLYKKQLSAYQRVNEPRLELHYYQKGLEGRGLIDQAKRCLRRIERAAQEDQVKSPKVFLISRYHFNLEAAELKLLKREFSQLSLNHLTAHASKGREADYVVILSLENKVFGFPNRKDDDPIIDLVLPSLENYQDAEESRLFYVAMSRARHRTYCLANLESPSDFIQTLKNFDRWVLESPEDQFKPSGVSCPHCKSGVLNVKRGRNGQFVSCNLFPVCNYSEDPCDLCHQGVYKPISTLKKRCHRTECGHERSTCPKCRSGLQVLKQGKFGSFYSCSHYPHCDHSENACERCGKGLYESTSRGALRCNQLGCGHEVELCPRCKSGQLRRKNGRNGAFMGGSNYSSKKAVSCRYTRDL